jgi:type IV pilus assembly protein PilC
MHEALESLMRVQADSLSLWVTPELCKRVTNGHRLSTSVAMFPRIFPATYIALVRASEETGKLILVLNRLADWLDRREKIERHVKKALTYPMFVLITAVLLTLGLFRTVIPGILGTVTGLGVELPWPTQVLLTIVEIIEQPLTWLGVAAIIIAFVLYARTPEGWQKLLLFAIYTPVLGPILTFSSCSRYAHTMSMLLESGVDIIRAAKIAADASANPLIKRDSMRVTKALREGSYYGEVLATSLIYPPLLVDMIRVGDESGRMASLIRRCGEMMEEDTMHKVDTFLNLLEPLVLGAISCGVGFIVVAVLMPMSSIITAL